MNQGAWIWLGCFLGALCASSCGPSRTQVKAATKEIQGSPIEMPPMQLTDLDGKSWGSAQFRNRSVMVEFWASWCEPCRELSPELQAFYLTNRSWLDMLSISVDKDESAFRASCLKSNPKIPTAYGGVKTSSQWSVKQLPTLILVRDGRILGHWEGKNNIQKALEEIVSSYK